MAKHIFDTRGRKVGTILDDSELPESSGCFTIILICLALTGLFFLGRSVVVSHNQKKYWDSFEYMMEKYDSQVQADSKGEKHSPYGLSCVVCGKYFDRKPGQHFCSKNCERTFYAKKKAWESGKKK